MLDDMETTTTSTVLDIDIKGYRQTLQNKGKPRILIEGLSNAFDTKSTVVLVTFSQKDGWADLIVRDNDPDGFTKLRDAWTLFAASNRREDPEARGRFGQGEKELIAIAVDGGMLNITSTKGSVTFTKEGRQESKDKTSTGTVLTARLKLNQKEAAEFVSLVRLVIPPTDVVFKFNDDVMTRLDPVRTARETVDTVIWDADGNMKDSRRQTDIEIFEAPEQAWIYELGIPVVEHDGSFHINVMQKVPLNSARDNVRPAYLRRLRQIMLDQTHNLLSQEDMNAGWVKDALINASPEAVRTHIEVVHGKKAVIADPFNPESNKLAVERGYTLVHGGSYQGDAWKRIKEHIRPAGQVLPTGVPTSPDGEPPIPRERWTQDMFNLERYTWEVGEFLLGFKPEVNFHNINVSTARGGAAAWWGGRSITFNLRWLGKRWPAEASQEDVDNTLLHEFSHHFCDDHTHSKFWSATTRLGAKLRSCKAALR